MALIGLTLAVISCDNPASGGGGGNDDKAEQLEFLKSMGVDTTVAPRLNSYGVPYPEDFDPLRTGTINGIPEIYTAGPFTGSGTNSSNGALRGFNTAGTNVDWSTSFARDAAPFFADNNYPMLSVALDINNNGFDEIVTVVNEIADSGTMGWIKLFVSRFPNTGQAFNHEEVWVKQYNYDYATDDFQKMLSGVSAVTDGNSFLRWKPMSISAADVDGDGVKEIVLAWAPDIYIIKLSANGTDFSASLHSSKTLSEGGKNAGVIMLDTADYLDNGKYEIAVSASYPVVSGDGYNTSYGANARFELYDENLSQIHARYMKGFAIANIACYDLDGDDLPDTLLWGGIKTKNNYGLNNDWTWHDIFLVKTMANKTSQKPEFFGGEWTDTPERNQYFDFIPAFLPVTRDGKCYIFADIVGAEITNVSNAKIPVNYSWMRRVSDNGNNWVRCFYGNAAVGDFNNDDEEEIVAIEYLERDNNEAVFGLTRFTIYDKATSYGWDKNSSSHIINTATDVKKTEVMSTSICAADVTSTSQFQTAKKAPAMKLEYLRRKHCLPIRLF